MKTFGLIVDDSPEMDTIEDGSPVEPPVIEPPATLPPEPPAME